MKYEIYQTKDNLPKENDNTFLSIDTCERLNITVRKENYIKVYEDSIYMTGTDTERLERIYAKHNLDNRPDADKMRSVSVSDIIKLDEKYYYVDAIGFREIHHFISKICK